MDTNAGVDVQKGTTFNNVSGSVTTAATFESSLTDSQSHFE